jgi:fructose-bisphosphate aldolase class II
MGRFADYGIRKGNVGTQWQNVAHKGLPADLMEEMRAWARENNKDIKMAIKPFKQKIDNIPSEHKKMIEDMAYEEAKELIKAFRAVGTASIVIKGLS